MNRFRIALSFAGEKQPYVEKVAAILAGHFGEDGVLYYPYHEARLSRRDLSLHLPKLYRDESDLIVAFICPDYDRSEWCGLEWLAIVDLFKKRLDHKIMLCRFEHATAEGLLSGTGFVDLDDKSPEYAATRILERLADNEGRPRDHYLKAAAQKPIHAALRLSSTSPDLVDRDEELAVLDQAWSGPKKKNVVTVVAWGGMGKTALVAHWAMAKLTQAGHGGIDRYFDWPFYRQGTLHDGDVVGAGSELFFKAALEFFGDPAMAASNVSAWQKGERLARLISRPGTLLILDALETQQEIKSGKLRDEGLRALFRSLAIDNDGLCIITSRQSVSDLATFGETTVLELKLPALSTAGGADLLKRLGVQGSAHEIETLASDMKGHALTLTLLGKYLAHAHQGAVRRRDHVRLTEADYEETSGHAFRVIDAYERWLAKEGREVELAILRILGLSDRPQTPDAINALLSAPVIPGLTNALAALTPARWNVAVKLLGQLGLVEEQKWEPPKFFGYSEQEAREGAAGEPHLWPVASDTGTLLDCHPIIREYCGQQLRDSEPHAWQTAHDVLFEHLRDSVPYWPEGLAGLQPLYQAVAHGCEAGRYDEACTAVYYDRILRQERAYSTRVLGAFAADLAAVRCFFLTPWTRVVPELAVADQSWLLAEAAFRLRGLGRLAEARHPLEISMNLAGNQQLWADAATRAANLADLELVTGDLSSSIRHAEQSITFADRSENAFQRYAGHSILGNVLHQCGHTADARSEFQKAEWLQAGADPFIPLLYSTRGFHYCDLLLADVESAAWGAWMREGQAPAETERFHHHVCTGVRDRALLMLHLAEDMHSALSIALARLTTARAELYETLLEHKNAHHHSGDIGEVVQTMRESGNLDEVPRALLTSAWYRAAVADMEGAHSDLAEAQQIAELGPMPLHLADVHLYRARLFFRDDLRTAREDLARARKLIDKHGYGRRSEELEDAEAAIEESARRTQ